MQSPAVLGADRVVDARREGAAMSYNEIITYAQAELGHLLDEEDQR